MSGERQARAHESRGRQSGLVDAIAGRLPESSAS